MLTCLVLLMNILFISFSIVVAEEIWIVLPMKDERQYPRDATDQYLKSTLGDKVLSTVRSKYTGKERIEHWVIEATAWQVASLKTKAGVSRGFLGHGPADSVRY